MSPLHITVSPETQRYANKTDMVTEGLRKAFLRGEIQSGQKLSSEEICKAFGVSRAPVREALRRLESDGLVQIFPQLYVQVTQVDSRSLHELSQVRSCLEELALQLAIPNFTDGDLEWLQDITIQESLERDREKLFEIALEFHRGQVRCSGNQELLHVYTKIMAKWQWYVHLEYHNPAYIEERRYHARTVELLKAKKYGEALELLREDIAMCERNTREQMEAVERAGAPAGAEP